jgi:hypothetical protein
MLPMTKATLTLTLSQREREFPYLLFIATPFE